MEIWDRQLFGAYLYLYLLLCNARAREHCVDIRRNAVAVGRGRQSLLEVNEPAELDGVEDAMGRRMAHCL